MAHENRPAGNSAGKIWIIIGLLIAVFGIGLTLMTNKANEKQIESLTKQCEEDGHKAVVTEEKSFLSTSYNFNCEK